MGIAVCSAAFTNQMSHHLGPEVGANAEALAYALASKKFPNGPLREKIVQAFVDSLRVVWGVLAGLAFLAFLVEWATKDFDVGGQKEKDKNEKDELPMHEKKEGLSRPETETDWWEDVQLAPLEKRGSRASFVYS